MLYICNDLSHIDKFMKTRNNQLIITFLLILLITIAAFVIFNQIYKKDRPVSIKGANQYNNINNPASSPLDEKAPIVVINYKSNSCKPGESYSVFDVLKDGQWIGEVRNESCESVESEVLAQTEDYVYFTILPGGIGGYIVYNYYINLYRLNLSNNEIVRLKDLNSDLAFSNDKEKIAYFSSWSPPGTNNRLLLVQNLNTWVIEIYEVPNYVSYGDLFFSPVDDKLAFSAAAGNPDNEESAVYILNLRDYNPKTNIKKVAEVKNKIYNITGWADNQTITYK